MKVEKVQRKDLKPGDEFVNANDWESSSFLTRGSFLIRAGNVEVVPGPDLWVYRIKEDKS